MEDFRPKFLAGTSMGRKAADAAIGAIERALTEMGRKHARDVRLVHPAHTTMDCRRSAFHEAMDDTGKVLKSAHRPTACPAAVRRRHPTWRQAASR